MSAYVIAHYDITNPDGYAAYAPAAGPSVFQYGGEVLAADRDATVMEGARRDNVLILRFPSAEAAQKWYDSPEYQAALPHRQNNTANGSLLIVTEFVMPT